MAISPVGGWGSATQIEDPLLAPTGKESKRRNDSAAAAMDATVDVLDLSDEGQAAASAATEPLGRASLFGLLGIEPGKDSITIADFEEAQRKAQSALRGRLEVRFEKAGIDTSKEIRLQIGGDGQVDCTSDHPQRDQIEQMFVDDPSLRDEFSRFQCLTEMVGSMREGLAFQKAYAQDPQAAVAQYWYLFDNNTKASASLVINGDSYQAVYGRPGIGFDVINEQGSADQ